VLINKDTHIQTHPNRTHTHTQACEHSPLHDAPRQPHTHSKPYTTHHWQPHTHLTHNTTHHGSLKHTQHTAQRTIGSLMNSTHCTTHHGSLKHSMHSTLRRWQPHTHSTHRTTHHGIVTHTQNTARHTMAASHTHSTHCTTHHGSLLLSVSCLPLCLLLLWAVLDVACLQGIDGHVHVPHLSTFLQHCLKQGGQTKEVELIDLQWACLHVLHTSCA